MAYFESILLVASVTCLFTFAAFESLSELIKDKLQKSLDQSSLESNLKLLEALIKHWKGEILSVSVTRIAENCKFTLIHYGHILRDLKCLAVMYVFGNLNPNEQKSYLFTFIFHSACKGGL